MLRTPAAVLAAVVVLLATVAAASAAETAAVTIHVRSNGWHTEIVLPRAAMPDGALPESVDFPGANYLSLGWGDAVYFPAPDPGFAMTLRAALRPTPALMHVTGLVGAPRDVLPRDEVIAVALAPGAFEKLLAFVDASFDRGDAPRVRASQPGRHRSALFYPATGKFHLFNTCNTWTAKALAAAGLPVHAGGVITAEDLMRQLRK